MSPHKSDEVSQMLEKWAPTTAPGGSIEFGAYAGYEEHFRGNAAAKQGRLAELEQLVTQIREMLASPPVAWLDIGCGRGLLLDCVKNSGVKTFGIDYDRKLALEAQAGGHHVLCGHVEVILEELASSGCQFDVITASHIIEHLTPDAVAQLISRSHAILRTGGVLAIETPNAHDPRVMLGSFYRDPTHIRPYPHLLTEFALIQAGFETAPSLHYDHLGNSDLRALTIPKAHLKSARDSLTKAKARATSALKRIKLVSGKD